MQLVGWLRVGVLYAGGLLLLLGLLPFSFGIFSSDSSHYVRDPRTGMWELQRDPSYGSSVSLILGEILLVFGGGLAIAGLVAKPKSGISTTKDMAMTLKKWSIPALMLAGIPLVTLLLYYVYTMDPGYAAISLVLAVMYLFLKPYVKIIIEYCGFVYEEVEPQSTVAKIGTGIVSVVFGIFVIFIMSAVSSGFVFLPLGFVLNPIGFVLAFIVGSLLMVFSGVAIMVGKALWQGLQRESSTQESLETFDYVDQESSTFRELSIEENDFFNDIYSSYQSFKISGNVFEDELVALSKRLKEKSAHCYNTDDKKQYDLLLSRVESVLRNFRKAREQGISGRV